MKSCKINGKGKPTCDQIENLEEILTEMPDENEIQKNADIIKAIGFLQD